MPMPLVGDGHCLRPLPLAVVIRAGFCFEGKPGVWSLELVMVGIWWFESVGWSLGWLAMARARAETFGAGECPFLFSPHLMPVV